MSRIYLIKLVLTLILFFITGEVDSETPYTPRFVTPNQYNYDGTPCIDLKPPRDMHCPLYGVRVVKPDGQFLSQNEIEGKCSALFFDICPPYQRLFPDGNCRSCPSDFPILKGDGTGDLWCEKNKGCENDTDEECKLTFENPFNCQNGIKRTIQNSYRPCKWTSENEVVTIKHYYKKDDDSGRLTMTTCLSALLDHHVDDIDLLKHMIRTENSVLDHGFLQCPKPPEEYSFFSPLWIIIYSVYLIGAAIITGFYFYKNKLEANTLIEKSEEEIITREGSRIDEFNSEYTDIGKMYQLGYKSSVFGGIAKAAFWILSLFWNIFFLLIILDFYGLWYNTLCPAEINEKCTENPYSWRSGFSCTTGCLFSLRWTTGFDPYWPYSNNPGGIDQIYAIICIVFVLSGIWWIFTILFYDQISTFFSIRCSLHNATTTHCTKLKEKDLRVDGEQQNLIVTLFKYFEKFTAKIFDSHLVTEKCKVHIDESMNRFIIFQCIKYTFDSQVGEFRLRALNIASTKKGIHELGTKGLTSQEAFDRLKIIGKNQINYDVPSWSQTLWDELFNLFYLYQIIFLWIWYSFYYWLPAIFLTSVIISSAIISMLVKRSSQKSLKAMSEHHVKVEVKRDGKWVLLSNEMLVPGDIIKLHAGDPIVFDGVLISGRSVLNESALTGEPAPVPKLSVPNRSESFGHTSEDMKYTLLSGTTVESVSPGANGETYCIILSTGIHTKQGQLVRSMLFPPRLRFKFDDHFVMVFVILFAFGVFFLIAVSYLMHWYAMSIYFGIFTISHCLSPLIPAMFTAGQAYCSQQLKKKNIFCIEMNRTFVAAKVKTFCFDKTGTLTKQGMDFHGHCNSKGGNAILNYHEGSNAMNCNDRCILGCCHELEFTQQESNPDEVKLIGNEVDVAMFKASGFEFMKQENSSPIVKDLVTGNCYKIIDRYEFNRETMMMTSVVQELSSGKYYVYSKGSYEKVAAASYSSSLPQDLTSTTTQYAMKGHYILGIGSKELENLNDMNREKAESELNFVGLLHFKNELKEDTPQVLEHVKAGNINCVMITGDNIYTACSIAKESGLSTAERIIIGDVPDHMNVVIWRDLSNLEEVSILPVLQNSKEGMVDIAVTNKAFDILRKTPVEHFLSFSENLEDLKMKLDQNKKDAMRYLLKYTRIFARMKPDHKVEAVRMNMEEGVTGMCGDGANDAAALRLAHCGIAIATGGGHATIVAPFSSASHSLSVVTDVIRYGRASLASAFAGYKRLIMAGQTTIIMKLIMYQYAIQISEVTWIFIDGFINVGLSLAMLQSKPASRLTPTRPTSSLIGKEVITSIIFQILVVMLTFITSFILLYQQQFFACKNFDASLADLTKWWTMGDNYESSLLSILTLFLIINQAFVFNIGFEYRKWWFRNYSLLILWTIFLSLFLIVLFNQPSFLPCLFRVNCGDMSLLRRWDDLGNIIIGDIVPLAPAGCPCNLQIGYVDSPSYTCENEYINCNNSKFNSVFHHTIFPMSFRITIFIILLISFAVSLFFEWFVIYGPVRQLFRKFQKQKQNVFSIKA